MSEQSNQDGTQTGEQNTSNAGDGRMFTQDEVNAIMSDFKRDLRTENEQLRQKAEKFDEMEHANKSELEKMQDAVSAAEKRAQSAESSLLRSQAQATYGLSNEDAELFLTATDKDGLTRQAQALADRLNDQRPSGVVPREGRLVERRPEQSDESEFVGRLFGKSD